MADRIYNAEAERYTTEMWQRALGRVCQIVVSSPARQQAFADGFNGLSVKSIHHTARDAWADGRHSAVLLGYIPAPTPAGEEAEVR